MNTSLLKQIGLDIARGTAFVAEAIPQISLFGNILAGLLPASAQPKAAAVIGALASPAVTSDISKVDDAIKAVEGFAASTQGVTGLQKFQAATTMVQTMFSDAMSVAGHDVQDQALLTKSKTEFDAAIAQLVQSRVDFLNSLKPKS